MSIYFILLLIFFIIISQYICITFSVDIFDIFKNFIWNVQTTSAYTFLYYLISSDFIYLLFPFGLLYRFKHNVSSPRVVVQFKCTFPLQELYPGTFRGTWFLYLHFNWGNQGLNVVPWLLVYLPNKFRVRGVVLSEGPGTCTAERCRLVKYQQTWHFKNPAAHGACNVCHNLAQENSGAINDKWCVSWSKKATGRHAFDTLVG